ncbi:MAG TPA: hypothetical protein VFU49_19815 [Ktedonobacteraceae bacterium]|nr:hypothetical protein [Ktedonobacteraceae bacterium]
MKRLLSVMSVFLLIIAAVAIFSPRNNSTIPSQVANAAIVAHTYRYYTLKGPEGFVLARASKGAQEQPLGTPQPLIPLGDGFGQYETDSIGSIQLSPDGQYLAIDGVREAGEQVWIYDMQRMTVALQPPAVVGNFLHWLPGGHSFLYRPMFPMGPDAPMDSNGWNPGLWIVDAATGAHKNLDIGAPSADLIDAAASPDGSRIIYSTTPGLGMGSDTFLMLSDGSNRAHLFSTAANVQSIAGLFAWSPDGTRIAYERLSDSSVPFLPAGLWVMDSQGGHQQRLTDVDGGHGYGPVWSPDGRKIAFVARTNVSDQRADVQAQALQSAIGVVDIASTRSWLVDSSAQTGAQLSVDPIWTSDSASVTFTAMNPANLVVGGTPRYWSTSIVGVQNSSQPIPLTPTIAHVVAEG